MLDKLFGQSFGADVAEKMIVDLMEKLNDAKGTQCIAVMLDDKKQPVLVEYKFNVPEKFLAAKETITSLQDRVSDLESEVSNYETELSDTEHKLDQALKELEELKNDTGNE